MLTQAVDDYVVLIPKRYSFEVMALVEIQPKLTRYIEEKGVCRKDTIPELIVQNFTAQLGENCGNDACFPKEFLMDNSTFKTCENMHDWTDWRTNCAFNRWVTIGSNNE